MAYSAEERETVCITNDEDKTWTIETYMQSIVTKLRKAGIEPDSIREDGRHLYKNVPFNQVSFRSKSERTMSDEQKAAAAERLKNAREAKKAQ